VYYVYFNYYSVLCLLQLRVNLYFLFTHEYLLIMHIKSNKWLIILITTKQEGYTVYAFTKKYEG